MVKLEKASMEDVPKMIMMEQSPDTTNFIIPYSASEHRSIFSDPAVLYLRVINDAEFAGFIILAFDPDGLSAEFRRIVISDKGTGIGQQAIKAMELFCRTELKRSRIWLDVFSHNTRGQHIYEKLGYKKFENPGNNDKNLLFYEKEL